MRFRPKDHTFIIVSQYGEKNQSDTIAIWYEDYGSFDDLPDVAKSDETRKEYDAFWDYLLDSLMGE